MPSILKETSECPVCGEHHSHNTEDSIKYTDNYRLCATHEKMYNKGYIALIAIDDPDISEEKDKILHVNSVKRTGDGALVTRDVFKALFNTVASDISFAFVSQDVIAHLKFIENHQKKEATLH